MGGARDSKNRPIYGWYPYDTGIAAPVWRSMHLGMSTNSQLNSVDAVLGADTLRYFALSPPDPSFDQLTFDFDKDLQRTAETAAINDATSTYLSTFAERGAKMIVYHGLSDQGMSTGALSTWYEHLTPARAGGAQSWARLFLIPGMTHCGGGLATDRFDMLAAILAWVEKDKAPDRIIATGTAFPGVSRPLCPYPKIARYTGGDSVDERSFACAE
jgi:feruloyl esterase